MKDEKGQDFRRTDLDTSLAKKVLQDLDLRESLNRNLCSGKDEAAFIFQNWEDIGFQSVREVRIVLITIEACINQVESLQEGEA